MKNNEEGTKRHKVDETSSIDVEEHYETGMMGIHGAESTLVNVENEISDAMSWSSISDEIIGQM